MKTDLEQFQESLQDANKIWTRDEIIVIVVDGVEHHFNADGSERK